METKKRIIPEQNIKTYLHIYKLLNRIQRTELGHLNDAEKLKFIRRFQERFKLPQEWYLQAAKAVSIENIEVYHILDPYRSVAWTMAHPLRLPGIYKTSPKQKAPVDKGGKPVEWGFNFLLYALVIDMGHYKGNKNFTGVLDLLTEHKIPMTEGTDSETLRKRYNGINTLDLWNILQEAAQACEESGEPFFPEDVIVKEWPIDFLTCLAHETKTAPNRYLGYFNEDWQYVKDPFPDNWQSFYPLAKNRK